MRLGELERAVIEVLWAHPDGVLAREVAEALPSGPAATTVLTVLERLSRKGLVSRQRAGRAHRYRAQASREEFVAEAMRAALADADNLDTALTHFIDTASAKEAAALRRALEALPEEDDR